MAINYTPIDIEKLKKEDNKIVDVLLVIVTITLAVLAVLIFFLIQKKMKDTSNNFSTPSSLIVSPTAIPEETPIATSEPSPTLEPTFFSSPSSQLETPMEEKVLPTTESSNLNKSNE